MKRLFIIILSLFSFVVFAAPAYQFGAFVYQSQSNNITLATMSQNQILHQDDRCFNQCESSRHPFVQCKQMCSF